jgi:phage recombination protein Bet
MSDETTAVVPVEVAPPEERRGFLCALAEELQTDPKTLWNTVRQTCFPEATDDQLVLYLMVCQRYKLDPVLREAYPFADKRGGVHIGVTVDGWLKIANRDPQCDGHQVEDVLGEKGVLLACTATVWRKDREHPVMVTEYLSECRRNTPQWDSRPHRMLRHKALIQAIRYAYGISGISDMEEAREAQLMSNGQPVPMLAQNREEAIERQLTAAYPEENESGEGAGSPSEESSSAERREAPDDTEQRTAVVDSPAFTGKGEALDGLSALQAQHPAEVAVVLTEHGADDLMDLEADDTVGLPDIVAMILEAESIIKGEA